jgi:hypothetical protein
MGSVEVGFSTTVQAPAEPSPRKGSVSIGVDIGKIADPTAVVIAEGFPSVDELEETYEIRSIRRLKLGTTYPEVISTLVGIVEGLHRVRPTEAPWLVIDGTGVGEPISDEIRSALQGQNVRITTAIFTAGERFKGRRTDARVTVGKDWMVARLQVLLENRRIKLPTTAMARELAKELQTFEIRKVDGHDVSGAFRTGAHDDLVVALGLACLEIGTSVYEGRGLVVI